MLLLQTERLKHSLGNVVCWEQNSKLVWAVEECWVDEMNVCVPMSVTDDPSTHLNSSENPFPHKGPQKYILSPQVFAYYFHKGGCLFANVGLSIRLFVSSQQLEKLWNDFYETWEGSFDMIQGGTH